jgi:hypothetical protein
MNFHVALLTQMFVIEKLVEGKVEIKMMCDVEKNMKKL